MKNMMSDRVQFLSILNTAHRSSVACAAFPDFFFRHFKGMSEERQKHRRIQTIKQTTKQTHCHSGWLECLFDPFLVGSL